MRVTGAAKLETRPNQEERDVMNTEWEVPEKGTEHSQASPAGSKGPSSPSSAALLYIQVLQSTHVYTYHCIIFGGLLLSVMMGTHI